MIGEVIKRLLDKIEEKLSPSHYVLLLFILLFILVGGFVVKNFFAEEKPNNNIRTSGDKSQRMINIGFLTINKNNINQNENTRNTEDGFKQLSETQNKKKQEAEKEPEVGNMDTEKKTFSEGEMDKEQTTSYSAAASELINTLLVRATLYQNEDRKRYEYYLKKAIKIDATHYEANNLYGLYLMREGKVEEAISKFENMLAILAEKETKQGVENKYEKGMLLGNLGLAYYILGEELKAKEYLEKALAISREIGDRQGEGNQLGFLGNVYVSLGEKKKALEYFSEALKIFEEMGSLDTEIIRENMKKLNAE